MAKAREVPHVQSLAHGSPSVDGDNWYCLSLWFQDQGSPWGGRGRSVFLPAYLVLPLRLKSGKATVLERGGDPPTGPSAPAAGSECMLTGEHWRRLGPPCLQSRSPDHFLRKEGES